MEIQSSVGYLYAKLCLQSDSTIQILKDCEDEFIQKLIETAKKASQSPHF